MRLQKVAKVISWLSFIPILVDSLDVNLCDHVKLNNVSIAIYALIVIHICLLLTNKYVAAFRFTIAWIAVYGFVFLMYLYPDPHHSSQHVSFTIAICLWLLGGGALAIAGWFCHKAILEIKHGPKTHDLGKPVGSCKGWINFFWK